MAQQQTRQNFLVDEIETAIGTVVVVAKCDVLVALDFADCWDRLNGLLAARFGRVKLDRATDPGGFSSRVESYFGGAIGALQDAPVEMGGTPFQRTVWAALRKVLPGTTASYGELAASIGRGGAARAVGSANARNPVALAIPCHRIVGSNGSLTGYAGGIDRKRWLLQHESAHSARPVHESPQSARTDRFKTDEQVTETGRGHPQEGLPVRTIRSGSPGAAGSENPETLVGRGTGRVSRPLRAECGVILVGGQNTTRRQTPL